MRGLRKGLSGLLALVMVLSLLPVFPAWGADGYSNVTAVIEAPERVTVEDDPFMVSVKLQNIPKIGIAEVVLYYDPDVVEPVTAAGNPLSYNRDEASGDQIARLTQMKKAMIESEYVTNRLLTPIGERGSGINNTRGLINYSLRVEDFTLDVELPENEIELMQIRFKPKAPGIPKFRFAAYGRSPHYMAGNLSGVSFSSLDSDGVRRPMNYVIPDSVVEGSYSTLNNVILKPKDNKLALNSYLNLDVTRAPESATDQKLVMFTLDSSIALVDTATLEIRPLKIGETEVYAIPASAPMFRRNYTLDTPLEPEADSSYDWASIEVVESHATDPIPDPSIRGVLLKESEITLEVGATQSVDINFIPADTKETAVNVESSDESYVSAEVKDGKLELTALKEGVSTVTVTSRVNSAYSADVKVTVTKATSTATPPASSTPSSSPITGIPGGQPATKTLPPLPSEGPSMVRTLADYVEYLPNVSSPDEDGLVTLLYEHDSIMDGFRRATSSKKPFYLNAQYNSKNGLMLVLPSQSLILANENHVEQLNIMTSFGKCSIRLADLVRAMDSQNIVASQLNIKIQTADAPEELVASAQLAENQLYTVIPHVDDKELTDKDLSGVFTLELTYDGDGDNQTIALVTEGAEKPEPVPGTTYIRSQDKFVFSPSKFGSFAIVKGEGSQPLFPDLADAEWSREFVEQLAAQGIVSGNNEGNFEPNRNITRAEFVKMLVGALGILDTAATCDFSDVADSSAWFYPYVASAAKHGITEGYDDGSFGVNNSITREEVATMAYRAAVAQNRTIPQVNERASFADEPSISGWALEAVGAMQMAGFLSGKGDNQFAPQDNATRAESAKIIFNIYELK